jgi:5-methylcytosine-specific restriction endonuclease McrA
MCASPRCKNILALQMHHIVWVWDGGQNDPKNLVALCGHCHDQHTRGYIPLQSLNQALDRESLDLLIFLRCHSRGSGSWRFCVSGDGSCVLHV